MNARAKWVGTALSRHLSVPKNLAFDCVCLPLLRSVDEMSARFNLIGRLSPFSTNECSKGALHGAEAPTRGRTKINTVL